MLGGVPDGGVVLHDVKGEITRPLFDVLSQAYHFPLPYLPQLMRRKAGIRTVRPLLTSGQLSHTIEPRRSVRRGPRSLRAPKKQNTFYGQSSVREVGCDSPAVPPP